MRNIYPEERAKNVMIQKMGAKNSMSQKVGVKNSIR